MSQPLTQAEQLAAQIFTSVSLQCAFTLEDPNGRFEDVFQSLGGETVQRPRPTSVADIANKTYKADVGSVPVVLETNPPGIPALSRVLVSDGRGDVLTDAIRASFADHDYFRQGGEGSLPLADGVTPETGMRNRLYHLITDDKYKLEHDIAMLVSWFENDDARKQVELAAWPIKKQLRDSVEQS